MESWLISFNGAINNHSERKTWSKCIDVSASTASNPSCQVEPKVAKSLDAAYENVRRFHAAQAWMCRDRHPGLDVPH